MRQYYDIKRQNPGLIIFFRLGDFYEMFDADAKEVSQILGIALTARHGIPMCGVPYHSAGNYLSKLIKTGKKVGICEQVGADTSGKKKIFMRKIVRVITPGTVIEDNMLESTASNYIAAITLKNKQWAIAAADVSTGEFWVTQKDGDSDLLTMASVMSAVQPAEIVLSKETLEELSQKIDIAPQTSVTIVSKPLCDIPPAWPADWQGREAALESALMLINYITLNDAGFKDLFVPFYKEISDYLSLDENAIRTLELTEAQAGGRKGSLWHLMDFTATPMGSRTLKNWLLNPLLNIEDIKKRQACVEGFFKDDAAQAALTEILKEISDVERIMSRTATATASPRDLAGLRKSLSVLYRLQAWLGAFGHIVPSIHEDLGLIFNKLLEMYKLLDDTLHEEPPLRQADGGLIKDGFNEELDELRALQHQSRKFLDAMCLEERKNTGINTLKIGYSSVFGYYIEVTHANTTKIPYNYKRVQTLTNGERYSTPELKALEEKILTAEEKALRLEIAAFDELRAKLAANIKVLRLFASSISELDIYNSFASAAKKYNFVKPEITQDGPLRAVNARHPVVEASLSAGSYVPNDINIGADTQVAIITGPNMGGKSVYLKMTAILTILAQAGSFVPADSASVGITDKIMTRIGAQDALLRGESTFMVEMKETAHILAGATKKSLVLLDEVGRGTSTFDGISIAWAIVEFLYKPQGGGAKVFFATHYFELTDLSEKYPAVKNLHVEVHEYKDNAGASKIAFMYKIKDGPADRSYGVHVAELAGLPQSCLVRAKKVLKDLQEKKGEAISKKERNLAPDIFSSPLIEEIRITDINKLTPIEALQLIAEWKKRINE